MEQPHRSAGYHRINRDERLGTYGSIISDVGINGVASCLDLNTPRLWLRGGNATLSQSFNSNRDISSKGRHQTATGPKLICSSCSGFEFYNFWASGANGNFFTFDIRQLFGIPQDIAPAPHCLDIVGAACSRTELFAKLANKYIDNFQLWFVHSTV